jgi:hypothetical protein
VGFELTIPALERGKTVHALDRASTVTGRIYTLTIIKQITKNTETKTSSTPVRNSTKSRRLFYHLPFLAFPVLGVNGYVEGDA